MTEQVFGIKITGSGTEATAAVRSTREEIEKFDQSAKNLGLTTDQLRAKLDAYNGTSAKAAQAVGSKTIAASDASVRTRIAEERVARRRRRVGWVRRVRRAARRVRRRLGHEQHRR